MSGDDLMCFGGEHVAQLDALAASLPPWAVLAHVVTEPLRYSQPWSANPGRVRRAWAKIGDEPWSPVRSVEMGRTGGVSELTIQWPAKGDVTDWRELIDTSWHCTYRAVTPSVTWEQGYGLRGRHEVMGVVG